MKPECIVPQAKVLDPALVVVNHQDTLGSRSTVRVQAASDTVRFSTAAFSGPVLHVRDEPCGER